MGHMSIFRKKINVSDATLELINKAVEISGASSVDEFAEQILSKESSRIINQAGKGDVTQDQSDEIANKLKGLGYLE